jgi:UDP-GlcNAc:undecaprenyl-phosphate GlcNAc-1-phosphate transferase
MNLILFISAGLCSLIIVNFIRRYSYKKGLVIEPREDRWHKKPTATFGGVGIFTAFFICMVLSYLVEKSILQSHWGIILASILAFILGLLDDVFPISPIVKIVSQFLIATVVITAGYTTKFFTPRIPNEYIALVLNIALTYLWIIGITNAINLLDNMDGLAGGISLISAIILSFFFWNAGNQPLLFITLALAGSILGFLFYNFPPASIFMGNSGSSFLGLTLAVLAIAREPQASNLFAVLGVPTLIFLLPILDITLVTISRSVEGKSILKGGIDHTSHRLIAFGFSERKTLIILFGVALIAGISAGLLEYANYLVSLLLVPLMVIGFTILAIYLGEIKVRNKRQ